MRKCKLRIAAVLLLVLLLPLHANASWLSDITGVDINVPGNSISFGVPRPDRIPQMLQNLPKDVAVFLVNPFAGSALAYAIRESKESARRVCGPVPPNVVQTLSRFFPPNIFPGVCWAIVGNGFSLDSYVIHDRAMSAITLEDVIVFRSAQDAYDPILWAHELTHVRQYQTLGVEGFAAFYSVAWDFLEQQARDFDQFVTRSLQAANPPPQYWVAASGWNNPGNQLTLRQFATYARQSTNPSQCSSFQHIWTHSDTGPPAYVEVADRCTIPIRVTSFQFRNTQTGNVRDAACLSDCTVVPSTSRKWPVDSWEEAAGVNIVWPTTDLCQSGTYKEPGKNITWSLTFGSGGMTGVRMDNGCTVSFSPGALEWKGELRCNNGSFFPMTMTPVNACQRITSSVGWFQLER